MCVNIPVVVPPSAVQFVNGAAVVPQHVPRAVIAAPPLEVTLAPSVADVLVIEVTVGEVTVGAVSPAETVIVAALDSAGVAAPLSTIIFPVYVPAVAYELLLVAWVVTLTALHLYPTEFAEHVPAAGADNVPHAVVTVATLFDILVQFHQKE